MNEMVLYYAPGKVSYAAKLKSVLVRMKVRIKNVSADQVGETVGYLAGLPGFEARADLTAGAAMGEADGMVEAGAEAGAGAGETAFPVIPEEVLVMKNFSSGRIDELLWNLRKAGVPKIALKAVVTETNSQWTFYQLYEEIRKEHEEMSAPREEGAKDELSVHLKELLESKKALAAE